MDVFYPKPEVPSRMSQSSLWNIYQIEADEIKEFSALQHLTVEVKSDGIHIISKHDF